MKLQSLALTLALLPAALFAGNANSGTPTGPTVIPGGVYTAAYVINTPGSYVLGGNRTVSGSVNGIEITASDVTLDLGGFALSQAGGAASGNGIYIPAPENVEIRNGSILNAGNCGIQALTGSGVRVTGVRVASVGSIGILVKADGAQIAHCHVADASWAGIATDGGGAIVTDCMVVGLAGTGTGVSVQNGGRTVRTVTRGGKWGFYVGLYSSAVDCTATAAQAGFVLNGGTLRNVDVLNNTIGVNTNSLTNVIMGSRVTDNTTNFSGLYSNGGGNFIQ